jgi:dephospho-CoA kinase
MRTIGLTGGIATGKSTVARLLRARGVPVVDADQAARAVLQPGAPALAQVVAAFGPEVLTADGHLDRAAMRARIAADPDARRTLEGITHPAIAAHVLGSLAALAADGAPLAFVEAALMVETGSYRRYDALWVVTCAPETQLARLRARDGGDEATLRGLVAAQLPLAAKEAVADVLIRNDGDEAALAIAVDAALAAERLRPARGS